MHFCLEIFGLAIVSSGCVYLMNSNKPLQDSMSVAVRSVLCTLWTSNS